MRRPVHDKSSHGPRQNWTGLIERFCGKIHQSCRDPLTALRQRVRELAHARVRFGYRRIFMLLKREGWDVGKERLYRLYREEGLGLRRKRPWRHVSAAHRLVRTPAKHRNEVWSMDFVADELADHRRFRALTVIDVFTRECLEIEIGQSLRSEDVVRVLERLKYERGLPARIYCDNGSEFASGHADKWARGWVSFTSAMTSRPVCSVHSTRTSLGAPARPLPKPESLPWLNESAP